MSPNYNADKLNTYLVNFDSVTIEKYLHELIDSWLLRGKLNYEIYAQLIDIEYWWNLEAEFENIFKLFIHSNDLNELLINYNIKLSYSSFVALYNLRKNDLLEYYLDKSNNLSGTKLKDFDWGLSLITCSDKMSKLNQPVLRLSLSLAKKKSDIYFEMNKNELDSFIHELETIQKHIEVYD